MILSERSDDASSLAARHRHQPLPPTRRSDLLALGLEDLLPLGLGRSWGCTCRASSWSSWSSNRSIRSCVGRIHLAVLRAPLPSTSASPSSWVSAIPSWAASPEIHAATRVAVDPLLQQHGSLPRLDALGRHELDRGQLVHVRVGDQLCLGLFRGPARRVGAASRTQRRRRRRRTPRCGPARRMRKVGGDDEPAFLRRRGRSNQGKHQAGAGDGRQRRHRRRRGPPRACRR